MRAPALALILCFAAGSALAQTAKPQSAKPAPEAATPVAPVTIMPPTEKPKVVATWPAEGQVVAPGVLVLKISFDQQMTPRDFAYGLGAGDALSCLKTPRLLNDAKTFVLLCTTLPGKTYTLSLNTDGAPHKDTGGNPAGFSNIAENRAAPSQLSFTTGTGEPVTKLREAVKAAGLGDLDLPIEEAPQMATAAR